MASASTFSQRPPPWSLGLTQENHRGMVLLPPSPAPHALLPQNSGSPGALSPSWLTRGLDAAQPPLPTSAKERSPPSPSGEHIMGGGGGELVFVK